MLSIFCTVSQLKSGWNTIWHEVTDL
uniref:Uncharacterized protein n=1 Tax=Anguilla anguilla TaxID=7936 RepID=A0A0E9W456_ANGAN